MKYFIFKHGKYGYGSKDWGENIPNSAFENNFCFSQFEYGFQGNSTTTNNWKVLKEVKVGDIIILSRGDLKYAWGYAIKPRFENKDLYINRETLNCSEMISTYHDNYKYRSDSYNGYIEFEDCECFYENLEDGKNEWGQRIDIDKWRDYNREGINCKLIYKSKSPPYNTIQEITEEDALNIVRKLKNDPNFEFEDKSMENYIELLKSNKNLILTGAPGTGKTYLAKEIAKEMTKIEMPKNSNDIIKEYYEKNKEELEKYYNECEELRKQFIEKFPKENLNYISMDDYCIGKGNKNSFCYWIERKLDKLGKFWPRGSGTYLLYRGKNGKIINTAKEKDDYKLIKEIGEAIYKMSTEKEYNENFKFKALTTPFAMKIYNSYNGYEYFPIFTKNYMNKLCKLFNIEQNKNPYKQNLIIKKYFEDNFDIKPVIIQKILLSIFDFKKGNIKIDNDKIILEREFGFVQFHPSYDYTDFMEGLRPIQDEKGNIGFKRKDGVFKKFCKEALDNPNNDFVFIIDEINRGEISKIFGELFFSIDPDYRGEKGKVLTQYANLIEDGDEFKDGFYIPENVYIIGTMNDIDRSVESMDFAMRRRFAWKEIKAEDTQNMLDEYKWENQINGDIIQSAKEKMNKLNEAISNTPELSDAYNIGASYFLKLDNYYNGDKNKAFEDLWKNHLEGLLFEYTRGMPKQEEIIENFKKAYYSNNTKTENNNEEENANNTNN